MIKFAKIIDEKTGICQVGIGSNAEFYRTIGMKELDVIKSEVDGNWYLTEKFDMNKYEKALCEKKKEEEKENIKSQLQQIDLKSIRALRCQESDRLKALEKEAQDLREKLNN